MKESLHTLPIINDEIVEVNYDIEAHAELLRSSGLSEVDISSTRVSFKPKKEPKHHLVDI